MTEASEYSSYTGFVFLYNLIVGAGALTIPKAFVETGVLYGILLSSILALASYATATFMVECIAGVNALQALDRERSAREISSAEHVPLLLQKDAEINASKAMSRCHISESDFSVSKKVEMADMAQFLFPRRGVHAFYVCVTLYLYGDLAIYAVAVPKSVRELGCPRPIDANVKVWECFRGVNNFQLYQMLVLLFGLILGPFAFKSVQSTKYLQLATTFLRHTSFGLMIVLVMIDIGHGRRRSIAEVMQYEKPYHIPTFLGVCIYSFMCHHSIPGLVAPIRDTKRINTVLFAAFASVLSVYTILCGTASIRFHPSEIYDVYTLNFKHNPVSFIAYFLSLFPVFTLSANFPLITITLRENLIVLFRHKSNEHESLENDNHTEADSIRNGTLEKYQFGLLAVLPPIVIAFFTEDVLFLVGVTGTYAGLGIQWVIPACLVYTVRTRLLQINDPNLSQGNVRVSASGTNPFRSPFCHDAWVYGIVLFSILFFLLMTVLQFVQVHTTL